MGDSGSWADMEAARQSQQDGLARLINAFADKASGRRQTGVDKYGRPVYAYGNSSSASFSSSGGGELPKYEGPGANRFEEGLKGAEGRLSSLLDDPSSIQQSAAYKFRLGQGEQALQRQQAAKGMAGSGNRLMELTKYGQDMASQEYDAQAGRLQNLLGTYAGNWNQAQGTNVQEALGKYGTATQGALGMNRLSAEMEMAENKNMFEMASGLAMKGGGSSGGGGFSMKLNPGGGTGVFKFGG